jgi:nucleoside-diphosphate-sugar epimerase
MLVVIAGGHGKVALRLTRLLYERGDRVRSLIRNPAHAADVENAGGEPVVSDLEHDNDDDLAQAIAGAQAIVFAAGAGPGSGPER